VVEIFTEIIPGRKWDNLWVMNLMQDFRCRAYCIEIFQDIMIELNGVAAVTAYLKHHFEILKVVMMSSW
jgi:hypothetical protein